MLAPCRDRPLVEFSDDEEPLGAEEEEEEEEKAEAARQLAARRKGEPGKASMDVVVEEAEAQSTKRKRANREEPRGKDDRGGRKEEGFRDEDRWGVRDRNGKESRGLAGRDKDHARESDDQDRWGMDDGARDVSLKEQGERERASRRREEVKKDARHSRSRRWEGERDGERFGSRQEDQYGYRNGDATVDRNRSGDEKRRRGSAKDAALADGRVDARGYEQVNGEKLPGPPVAVAVKQPKELTAAEQLKAAGKSGGVYIPPFRLAQMLKEVGDKSSPEYQRMTWDALRKSINGLVNKVNVANLKNILPELFAENLVRGRGLFARSCMKSQMASPTFTHVFAALVAVVNTKFPENGLLLVHRTLLQFRRAYNRNDKVHTYVEGRVAA